MALNKIKWLAAVTCIFPLLVSQVTAESRAMCGIATEAINAASKIRGLRIKQNVPCLVHDRKKVEEFVLESIDEQLPPERLKNEERVARALGIVPESYDYKKGIVDLYVSQIGGYYDPKRKHFVMAGWMPELMQPTIASHELTHALQDQYYNLEAMIDPKIENSDKLMAHSALIEGDATAVMYDYMQSLTGGRMIAEEPSVEKYLLQNVIGSSFTAQLGVPPALQLMLLFPYTSGLRFAHTQLRRGGYSKLDVIFLAPPATTEEILHPEKYPSKPGEYAVFTDNDVKGAELGEIVHRDTIGEFGISALLASHIGQRAEAAEAAAGWGGDRLLILEHGEGWHIVWRTRWDSAKDADQFFSAWERAAKSRGGSDFRISSRREGAQEVIIGIEPVK